MPTQSQFAAALTPRLGEVHVLARRAVLTRVRYRRLVDSEEEAEPTGGAAGEEAEEGAEEEGLAPRGDQDEDSTQQE